MNAVSSPLSILIFMLGKDEESQFGPTLKVQASVLLGHGPYRGV